MTAKDYIQLEEIYGAHIYHPLDIVIERGKASGFMMSRAKSISIF